MAHTPALIHKDTTAPDEVLAKEAKDHLEQHPPLQFVAELLAALRAGMLPWWTPEMRRKTLTATDRMRMLKQRADLRAEVMRTVTGAPPKFARRGEPNIQASYIDEFLEEDVEVSVFETAYAPETLAVYGDTPSLYFQFKDAMPWEEDSEKHQALVAALIGSFLKDRGMFDKKPLKPILTPWEVVNAIDPGLWHTRIPLETRVAVHKAWLALEKDKPSSAFQAKHTLAIITPEVIATSIKLTDLVGIFALAETKMGFERPAPKEEEEGPPPTRFEGGARSSAPPAGEAEGASPKA